MGKVQTLTVARDMDGKMLVEIKTMTSAGSITFPMMVDDHGSAAQTERQAYLELEKFLVEARELVQLHLA
jgi:hypothetical protein